MIRVLVVAGFVVTLGVWVEWRAMLGVALVAWLAHRGRRHLRAELRRGEGRDAAH